MSVMHSQSDYRMQNQEQTIKKQRDDVNKALYLYGEMVEDE